MPDPAPTPGWYVIRRDNDGAVSCLYTPGENWWAICGHGREGLLPGWSLVTSIDELLDTWGRFELNRLYADPRGIDP
jgi:hypothetical protein